MVLVILLIGITLFLAATQRDDLKDAFLKTFGLREESAK